MMLSSLRCVMSGPRMYNAAGSLRSSFSRLQVGSRIGGRLFIDGSLKRSSFTQLEFKSGTSFILGKRFLSNDAKPSESINESTNESSKDLTNYTKEDKKQIDYVTTAENFKLSAKNSEFKTSYPDINSLTKLFRLAKPEIKYLIVAFFCLIISSAISMLLPMVIGKLLDTGNLGISKMIPGSGNKNNSDDDTNSNGSDGFFAKIIAKFKSEGSLIEEDVDNVKVFGLSLGGFFIALGGIFFVGALANATRIILLKTTGERVIARLRVRILKRSLEQDAVFLDYNKVGDLISRLTNDASIITRSVTQNLSDGIRAVINGGVGLSMMCLVSLKLTGYLLLLGPPLALGAMLYGKKVRQISRKLQEEIGNLTKVAEESLSSTKTIQSFNGEASEVRNFSKQVRKVFNVGFLDAKYSGMFFGTTGFIGNCALLLLLSIGTSMVRHGEITVGDLTSFMMYSLYAGSSMFGVSNFYSELMKGLGAASRVFELNDRKPLIPATKGIKIHPGTLKGDITFENVDFFYPTRPNVNIFNKLNFHIRPGEHVCIVGPSGSGKSTIMHLLLRFYDPVSGSIKLDGRDIRNFNLKNYRRIIGVVQQEPLLFSGTIEENIKYGYINATKDEVRRAIELSNSNKFLDNFPNGIDTMIGPRGAQLSGGQKQRIALARALILRPKILILDEATSALDAESENAITRNINNRNIEGLTTISIAHRISTIKSATRIIVLKNGQMVETGTFKDLFTDQNSFLYELLSEQGSVSGNTSKQKKEGIDTVCSSILHDDSKVELEILEERLRKIKQEIETLEKVSKKNIGQIEEQISHWKH